MSIQAARRAAVAGVVYHDWDSKPDYDAIPQNIIDAGMQVADAINMPANTGFLRNGTLPSNPQNMYAGHANMLTGPYAHFRGATDTEFIEEFGPDFIHVPGHLINSLHPRLIDGHLQPLGADLPNNAFARVSEINAVQPNPGVAGAPITGPFAPAAVPQAASDNGKVNKPLATSEATSWWVYAGAAAIACALYYSSRAA